jgi:PGF-CTERM protein
MNKLKIDNKNSKNTDKGIKNLLKFGFIVLVGLILIFNATSLVSAHYDKGPHIVTEEVVINWIKLIACDEPKHEASDGNGPWSGEDVRVYTEFMTEGHDLQRAMFAYKDDKYEGVFREEYFKNGTEGSRILVGKTVFFHVDCYPAEKFNFEIRIWDDDSADDVGEIIKYVADALGVNTCAIPGSEETEVKVWGGLSKGSLSKGLENVIKKIMGDKDDDSEQMINEIKFDSTHPNDTQFTVQTKMVKSNSDTHWKKGDPGSKVNFTIKIYNHTDCKCNLEGYNKKVNEFIKNLKGQKAIMEALQTKVNLMHEASKRGDLDQTKALVNTFEKDVISLISSEEISLRDGNILVIYAHGYLDFMPVIEPSDSVHGTFTAIFDTTGAPTGTYIVKADDGDGHTDEVEVFITGAEAKAIEEKVEEVAEVVGVVIEEITATPTPKPTPAPAPEPTPTPPGFEAVFAIAGILAVTYLLRRRK